MSRFPEITPNNYTDEQNELAQKVASSRGGMRGPFVPALHSPGVLRAIEATGAYVRFENSLPDDLKELATITVGRFWGAQYEWYAHANLALKTGVDPAIVEAIRNGEAPKNLTPAQAAVYNFCVELNGTHQVSDRTLRSRALAFRHARRDGFDRDQRPLQHDLDDPQRRAGPDAGRHRAAPAPEA